MDNLNYLLEKYYIKNENVQENASTTQWSEYVLNETYWKVFFDLSFDGFQLHEEFNSKTEDERIDYYNFGIACFVSFVQGNFTGPDLGKEMEWFLSSEMFKSVDFTQMLAVNKEDIDVNTQYPALFVVSKIIFEWCHVHDIINFWWLVRSVYIHQQILEDLSPTLLSTADKLHKIVDAFTLQDEIKVSLYIEIAQLYLLFRHVSKAKKRILTASEILGINYNLVGKLGKRTRYQEKEIAQLTLEVSRKETPEKEEKETTEVKEDTIVPKNVELTDDVRLNEIEFSDKTPNKLTLTTIEQKLFLTLVQEMMLAKPMDELCGESLEPFIAMILDQSNTFVVRVVALLIRCKLEGKNRRTIERSLLQSQEILSSFCKESPPCMSRVTDVFSTGMMPIWKVESQYTDLLLNVGLVKESLERYLRLKHWEEVIVCYTILKLRHKAAEVIKEQLEVKPTVKLWCLLGDATDDVECYKTAWELSNKRSHRAQRHWGHFLFNRKKYEECIPHYEKSVSINPLQSNVWFRLGYAALQIENWQTAATAYRRYTTLEPDGFEAWNNLAQAYIKIGNKRNAHQAILEALKCNFENWKIWENLLYVSCDIANFADTIRAYNRLLDLKGKYLNLEALNILVHSVINNVVDVNGKNSSIYLKKTRELFGRITGIHTAEGYVWELYSSLAATNVIQAQRLQKAYRGYTSKNGWDKAPQSSQQVLLICGKLAEIILDGIDAKNPLVNSIRLNISSALVAIKKQNFEESKELLEHVSECLEKIVEKCKKAMES